MVDAGPDKAGAPLKPNSSYPFGYGDGGYPWSFQLAGKEIGFFKLYVCICPTDFSCILQSPHSKSKIQGGMLCSAGSAEHDVSDEGQWGTKLVTIIHV